MNIYSDITQIKKVSVCFDTPSDESKNKIYPDDQEWISAALEEIKNSNNVRSIQDRIACQVQKLYSFEPEQIIHLVNLLNQHVKKEPFDQRTTIYLSQEVAALIVKKSIDSFKNVLKGFQENKIAIQVMFRLVRESHCDPLALIKELHNYGIDPSAADVQEALIQIAKLAIQQNGGESLALSTNMACTPSTPEGQRAMIEIAKLAAQQDGYGLSYFIKNYGIKATSPEGQEVLIEIAKLAAKENGFGVSNYIQKYGINVSTAEGSKGVGRNCQAGCPTRWQKNLSMYSKL